MPYTKTQRSRNRGTTKSSSQSLKQKFSPPPMEKISRFFSKGSKSQPGEMKASSIYSPYKDCLSEVKCPKLNDTADDLDDFQTPTAIKKVSKIVNSKPPKKNPKKRKKERTSKLSMRKFIEDNFKGGDVNAEHLQMALALSESSYEAENPHEKLTPQEKMDSFKQALEKFGFAYGKNRMEVENKRDFCEIVSYNKKTNKKSRYRYITPILKMRTSQEREDLIASKVSLILAQNSGNLACNNTDNQPKLFSETLQQYQQNRLFKLNNLEVEELNGANLFYVGLKIETCSTTCGHLLKDWGQIAGREPSPQRQMSPKNIRSISPDLFDSDDEYQVQKTIACHNLDQSMKDEFQSPELIKDDCAQSSVHETFSSVSNAQKHNEEIIRHDLNQSEQIFSSDDDYQAPESMRDVKSVPGGSSAIKHQNPVTCHELNQPNQSFDSQTPEQLSVKPAPEMISQKNFKQSDNSETVNHNFRKNAFQASAQNDKEAITCYDLSQSNQSFYCQTAEQLSDAPEHHNFVESQSSAKKDSEVVTCYDLTQSDEEDIFLQEFSVSRKSMSPDQNKKPSKRSRFHLSPSSSESQTSEICASEPSKVKDSFVNGLFGPTEDNYISVSDFSSPEYQETYLNTPECLYQNHSPKQYQNSIHRSRSSESKHQYEKSPDPILQSPENFAVNWESPSRFNEVMTREHSNHNSEKLSPELHNGFPETVDMSPEGIGVNFMETTPRLDEAKGQDPESIKKLDSANTSEDSFQLSQETICISDDELNYSSVYATPQTKKESENIPPNQNPSLEDSFNDLLSKTEIMNQLETPQHSNVQIKTKNITPMANYDTMDTPKIAKELDKFGLKPLKRQRGVKLLKYIYETTHPLVEDDSEGESAVKKRRTGSLHFHGVVGDIECGEDEWVFERTQSKKIASCRAPLHIVWHNFIMSNPEIREKILLYEPLHLELLHSMLKEQGFKFNIHDLLTFLDKKCITIRTAQGQHYGKKPRT